MTLPSPPPAPRGRPAWLEWLLPAALTLELLGVGLRSTSFHHDLGSTLAIAGLYGLLALTLHLALRLALRCGFAWGALASLGLAGVCTVQLRLDAGRLVSTPLFGAATLLLAALYLALQLRLRPRAAASRSGGLLEPRELAAAYGALAALVLGTGLGASRSEELRWHLLRHHRLFGTPLYALTSRSLRAERDGLWTRRGRLESPRDHAEGAPPAPVLFRRPPHVVFLLIDTLRADGLAALGGARDWMPRMNARAEGAVLFSDVHANASWTRASCASIFTGLLPEEHGAVRFHERLAEDWVTLPERLRESGYQTAAFVSNWVQVGRETGFAQGFEAFRELMSADEILASQGPAAHGDEVRAGYARADEVNRATLEWLGSAERDPTRPLFLYLHYLDPHSPYREPPEPGAQQDPHERKRGLYRQELRVLDRRLEDLLVSLGEILGPDTIVIFTSDHGEEFWEHDDWGHGHSLHDEVLHVPLWVQLPPRDGAPQSGRVEARLESRDLFALVLDLVGEPRRDLQAWGAAHARPQRYASQYLDRAEAARDERRWTGLRRIDEGDWSLIWSAFGPTRELYDRRADPGELDNRIDDEPGRAERLQQALEHGVRFWVAPERVQRSARDLDFLRALGYAGGDEP